MYENKVVLGLIRVHILHHSNSDEGFHGSWMMDELKRHGYNISPGTMYPILHEMEGDGVIRSEKVISNGRVRKVYRITPKGREVLSELLDYVRELSNEVLG